LVIGTTTQHGYVAGASASAVEERGGGAPPSALFQWHAFVATQSVDPFGAEIGALQNASEPVD